MTHNNPLLLLDNSSMMNVIGDGEFSSHNMTLEETKAVLEAFGEEEIRICFSNSDITNIIFPWLGLPDKNYKFKEPKRMHVGQEALVFIFTSRPPKRSRSLSWRTALKPRRSRISTFTAST